MMTGKIATKLAPGMGAVDMASLELAATAPIAHLGTDAVDLLQILVNDPDLMALATPQRRLPGSRPRWFYQHWR